MLRLFWSIVVLSLLRVLPAHARENFLSSEQAFRLTVTRADDGKPAIVGSMIDAKGNSLSQEALDRLVGKPMTLKNWNRLEKSNWIADGRQNAPLVIYAFTDPSRPYCNKYWNDAQPWVKAGKIQVRHVVVGILRDSSAGKAAALLSAADPQAVEQISVKVRAQLDANEALMQQLGSSATPTIFCKDASGNLQMAQGAPSAKRLIKVLGPR